MKKRIFYVIPLAIFAVGFIIMQLLAGMKEEPARRTQAKPPKSVAADVIRMAETPTTITALGKLTSSDPVQLISEVAGVLQSGDVPFKPGTRFRQGDLLLRIDDRQVQLSLNSTKSDFLNALASVLPEIRVEFPAHAEVWQSYFDGCGFDSPLAELPEAQNRKIKLLLTRFNVYKLYYAARNLEITVSKHRIVAPFDGAVVSTALRRGSTARAGAVLGEVISLQDLELELPVPASDIPWIDRDRPVQLRARESEASWTGRILRVGGSVDQRSQTLPVYVSVAALSGTPLYEGMFLEAEIPGRPVPRGTIIPRRALYEERFVYIVENGTLLQRPVHIVRRNPETVVIDRGLQDGDTLVTELLQGVSPGMPAQARLQALKGDSE
ncbi:MAG: efflux RND transporter periplasmic adaptor subunit [Bacteroidota bacterium]|nr:efflux RND transporter periplasmic adaptor subunit [Bacteroidota bacterium]